MCIVKTSLVVDTDLFSIGIAHCTEAYWSVVSWNCISVPSGAVLVCEGIKIGPLGASKSVDFGGGSLYRIGLGAASPFFDFVLLDFGSGVALALVS